MAEKMTRGQIQDLVGKFAQENPKYRQALLTNPKGTIEKQLNTSLGSVSVKAVADTRTPFRRDPYAARKANCRTPIWKRRGRQAGHHGELPRARWHGGQQHRHAAESLICALRSRAASGPSGGSDWNPHPVPAPTASRRFPDVTGRSSRRRRAKDLP
jgi:hypothetical protein